MNIPILFSLLRFNETTALGRETKEFLSSKMKSEKFKKNELIFSHGSICNRIFVIKKGLIRGFYLVNNVDITSWISIENEIFTSITGFFSQQPCKENIQALEDTYVDYLEYQDMEEAHKSFPDFALLNRKMMEEYYAYSELRSIITRIPGTSDRLNYFLKYYNPEIINRTPKKYLASLLNMRPETLSRQLKERSRNKL